MPELAAGNLRTCAVGRRVGQPGMDRVGDYGFVGNVEGYHRLGHGCVQNYLGGLGCRREHVAKTTFWVCKKEKKDGKKKKLTIAQHVKFCHMSKSQPNKSRGSTKEKVKRRRKKRCPTCHSGTISDADAATHEHDAFDRVQEVRINAYEERDICQRPRSYDGDSSLGAARARIRGLCPLGDSGGDGLDGRTTVIDALSHRIRVTRRKSLHTPEAVGAVDLGVVSRRPDEWHRCATVHLDVRWSPKRVQAPRGVYLGILGGCVSVHLVNRSAVVVWDSTYERRTVETPRSCTL